MSDPDEEEIHDPEAEAVLAEIERWVAEVREIGDRMPLLRMLREKGRI